MMQSTSGHAGSMGLPSASCVSIASRCWMLSSFRRIGSMASRCRCHSAIAGSQSRPPRSQLLARRRSFPCHRAAAGEPAYQEGRKAMLCGKNAGFLPQVQHPPQSDIKKSRFRKRDQERGHWRVPGHNRANSLPGRRVNLLYSRPLAFSAVSAFAVASAFTTLPAALQWLNHYGFHNQQDIFFAGVVRAKLRALAGV